jgi:transcriptional regulator with GAF, ATPase, and Fis domain
MQPLRRQLPGPKEATSMTTPTHPDMEGELAQARTTIAQQAAEIERLRRRLADERFAEELREALTLAVTAGTLASPVSHTRLLEMIVETAAHVISARAAALFLIDRETQELIFEVALGQKAHEVKKFRVPLGHGIAGLVAVSGQPIAISDARSDPRQAADIAQAVGYQPQSILCVPLFYNDQVTGVLELLDKEGAAGFSAGDMTALGLFANQAAVAIEQSRTHRNLAALIGEVMESLDEARGEQGHRLQLRGQAFAVSIEEDADYRQALDLAQLVREIVWQGEDELRACQTILRGFAEYLRSRPNPVGELGATL